MSSWVEVVAVLAAVGSFLVAVAAFRRAGRANRLASEAIRVSRDTESGQANKRAELRRGLSAFSDVLYEQGRRLEYENFGLQIGGIRGAVENLGSDLPEAGELRKVAGSVSDARIRETVEEALQGVQEWAAVLEDGVYQAGELSSIDIQDQAGRDAALMRFGNARRNVWNSAGVHRRSIQVAIAEIDRADRGESNLSTPSRRKWWRRG